jgi:adenosylcobinamide-GDP ribazoletransferase
VLHAFLVAFSFLTRIPLSPGSVEPRDLVRSLTWFPAVGAALGAVLFASSYLLHGALTSSMTAVVLVALLACLTGGLHLDGVADVFDALGGGGQRDRMLAILRDSRIGAHGAAGLIMLLIAKVVATAEILDGPVWALYAAPVAGRWAIVPLVVAFPYARPEGLGKAFHGQAGSGQLVGATLIAAVAIGWLGTAAMIPALAALVVAFLIAFWLHRHLGGLTGDVYGAALEFAELTFLVVAGLS